MKRATCYQLSALLLILTFVASCGDSDPHNQQFRHSAPQVGTFTIITETPIPAATSTATP